MANKKVNMCYIPSAKRLNLGVTLQYLVKNSSQLYKMTNTTDMFIETFYSHAHMWCFPTLVIICYKILQQ